MRMDDRVKLTGREPPPMLTAQTVAEELGWSVSRLLGYIATGCLPPPAVVNGVYRFGLRYATAVRCDGLHLPGTYSGLPAGSPWRENKKTIAQRRPPKAANGRAGLGRGAAKRAAGKGGVK